MDEDRDDRPAAETARAADRQTSGTPEPEQASKPETVEELRALVARYKQEAEHNWQQFLHAAADLENYKKQAARQREDAVQRTRASLLAVVLAVVDNLERALEHRTNSEGSDAVIEGIRMTLRHVLDLLANMGVRAMEAKGKAFDPKFHEAVDVASSEELGVDPQTVVEEIQRGYTLNGDVLRPARVRVAK